MCSSRPPESRRSLSARLTRVYALGFAAAALAIFLAGRAALLHELTRAADDRLLTTARRYAQAAERRKPRILQADFERQAEIEGDRMLLCLLDSNGVVLAASPTNVWGALRLPLHAETLFREGAPFTWRTARRGDTWRAVQLRAGADWLQAVTSRRDLEAQAHREAAVFALSSAASLAAAIAFGHLLLARAVRRLDGVRRVAREIAAGQSEQRVAVTGQADEVDALATTFNAMLDRQGALIRELRDMSDNLAHDVRGPLTHLRARAEETMADAQAHPDAQALAADVIEECARLDALVRTVLAIARLEAGVDRLQVVPLELGALLHEAADTFATVAEDAGLTLTLHPPPAPVTCRADAATLQRALANLLDNAIKYTPAGGRVDLVGEADGAEARIRVADNGPGIPAAEQARIFERFVRGDQSRSTPGTGLGLNLARALVQALGGRITLTSAAGHGSTFTIHLPLHPR